jgi:hypothetical protein
VRRQTRWHPGPRLTRAGAAVWQPPRALLFDPGWFRERLVNVAGEGYEHNTASIVAKALERGRALGKSEA